MIIVTVDVEPLVPVDVEGFAGCTLRTFVRSLIGRARTGGGISAGEAKELLRGVRYGSLGHLVVLVCALVRSSTSFRIQS